MDCFSSPGWVRAEDDCKDVDLTFSKQDRGCAADIFIQAVAQGCDGRIPEDTTGFGLEVAIDGDAPVVSCSLGTQNLAGSGAGVITDLKFDFMAVDGGDRCTATEDLAVSISVYSSEVVMTGEEVSLKRGGNSTPTQHLSRALTQLYSTSCPQMVSISTPLVAGGVPSIWAQDDFCESANSGKCKVSSPKRNRQYKIVVKAIDEAGNVGTSDCSTVVGNRNIAAEDPLFLLAKIDLAGGADPSVTEASPFD